MATLTEVAYYTRRGVVYGGVIFLALILLRFSWGIFSRWWIVRHPPPPPPPTVAFGVLPAPKFPEGVDYSSVSLRLETISGTTPDLGPQASVYFMPAFRANVLGLELATGLAARLGFLFTPTRVDEQVYEWTREGELPGKLSVNLVTGHFVLTTLWHRDAGITTARAPSEVQAIKIARSYLQGADLLPQGLSAGPTRVEYLRSGAGVFIPAVSRSEANFVRVHLFREDVNGVSPVTSDPDEALVQVVVSGAAGVSQVVEVQYRFSPVEIERGATYPLRSTLQAWQQLASGDGYVAKLVEGVGSTAVRKVELGYYDADVPQEFLQPVYVFYGDNGFVGYVPAVSSEWLSQ